MTPAAADPEWQMLSQKQKNRASEDLIKKVAVAKSKLAHENASQNFIQFEEPFEMHEELKYDDVEVK